MKKQRRWMKSAIETAKLETPALPFQRQVRRTRAGLAMEMPMLRAG